MNFPFPVSHSQITTYQQCPLKFHYKYRTKMQGKKDEKAGPALLNGIQVHAAIENFLLDKPRPTLTKDQEALFKAWLENCYPAIQEIELQPEITLKGAYNGVPLLGRLDIFYISDGVAHVVDVKTGNSLFFLHKKLWFSLQPDIYALLVHQNFPEVTEVVWEQHNVALNPETKVTEADITSRPVALTRERLQVLNYWLTQMGIDAAQPHEGWECSRCPYEDHCQGRLVVGGREKFTFYTTEEEDSGVSPLSHSDGISEV